MIQFVIPADKDLEKIERYMSKLPYRSLDLGLINNVWHTCQEKSSYINFFKLLIKTGVVYTDYETQWREIYEISRDERLENSRRRMKRGYRGSSRKRRNDRKKHKLAPHEWREKWYANSGYFKWGEEKKEKLEKIINAFHDSRSKIDRPSKKCVNNRKYVEV